MGHYIFLAVFTGGWLLAGAIIWFSTKRRGQVASIEMRANEPPPEMSLVLAIALKANLRSSQGSHSLVPEDREFFIAARFMQGVVVTRRMRNRLILQHEIERESRAFDPQLVERALRQIINETIC